MKSSQKEELKKQADSVGLSLSSYIRTLLVKEIQKHKLEDFK